MIAFPEILTTAKDALDANAQLELVPVVIDLGVSDRLIELHAAASGVVIALQPIFGGAPMLSDVNEGLDVMHYAITDMVAKLCINPQKIEKTSESVGEDSGDLATQNVILSDGSTINLWRMIVQIIGTIANIDGGETARAYTWSGFVLSQLNDGALCYDVSFDVRCQLEAEE